MAKATKKLIKKEKTAIVTEEVFDGVILELSKEEARILFLILGKISGGGARKYASRVYNEFNKILKCKLQNVSRKIFREGEHYLVEDSQSIVENDDNWC